MTTNGNGNGNVGWQFLVRWASLIVLGVGLIIKEAQFRTELLAALNRIAMQQERVVVSQQSASQSLSQLLIENQVILQADRDADQDRGQIMDAIRGLNR